MRGAGYSVDLLGSPATCFNASHYGTLLITDPENEFTTAEVDKLVDDVKNKGLGVVIFADWFNGVTAASLRFFDDNTRSWWTPPTGGANVPALNDLLTRLGAALGDAVLEGQISGLSPSAFMYASGANIIRFPSGGILHDAPLVDKASEGSARSQRSAPDRHAVLGVARVGSGALALYGDSGCVDTSHQSGDCHDLLLAMVAYAAGRNGSDLVTRGGTQLEKDWEVAGTQLPARRDNLPPNEALPFTPIVDRSAPPPACGPDAPLELGGVVGVVGGGDTASPLTLTPTETPAAAVTTPHATPAPQSAEGEEEAPPTPVPRRSSTGVAAGGATDPPPPTTPPPHRPPPSSASSLPSSVGRHLLASPPALAGLAALTVGGAWAARSRWRRRDAALTLPRTAAVRPPLAPEGVELASALRGWGVGKVGGDHAE